MYFSPSCAKRGNFDVSLNYKRTKTIRCTVFDSKSLSNSVSLLPHEARKLWLFIKLLENEDDSFYRSRLLILAWIQFPPPARKKIKILTPNRVCGGGGVHFNTWKSRGTCPPPPPPPRIDAHVTIKYFFSLSLWECAYKRIRIGFFSSMFVLRPHNHKFFSTRKWTITPNCKVWCLSNILYHGRKSVIDTYCSGGGGDDLFIHPPWTIGIT